jgi:hypothetical protein
MGPQNAGATAKGAVRRKLPHGMPRSATGSKRKNDSANFADQMGGERRPGLCQFELATEKGTYLYRKQYSAGTKHQAAGPTHGCHQ